MGLSARALAAGRAAITLSLLGGSDVEKQLTTLQKRVQRIGEKFQSVGKIGLAVGGAITGAFAAATKVFTGVGDKLNDMSTRTGFAIETLSALEYAAGQTGTSLDSVERASKGMARTLLNAERGSATAVDSLADLGLTFQQLAGMSPEQQFTLLADRISKIQDPTKRAGLALSIFGRAGTELLPMLKDGEKGIIALIAEAHRLGVVMSTEDAKAAAELDDAFNKLRSQLKAVFVQIGAAVAGDLQNFSDRMIELGRVVIDWTRENRALISTVAKIGVTVAGTGAALYAFGTVLKATAAAVGVLRVAITLLSAHPIIALVTVLGTVTLAALKFSGALEAISNWLGRITGMGTAVEHKINRITDAMNKAADATKNLSIEEQIAAKHKEMMEFAAHPKTLARLRAEMAELEARKARYDAAKNAPPDDPMGFTEAVTLDKLKPGVDFLRRKLRELQDEALKIFAPDMPALKASLKKTAGAGVRAAVEVGSGGSVSTFDTRLAAQMFGGGRIEQDQLAELRKIRMEIERRRGGIAVV